MVKNNVVVTSNGNNNVLITDPYMQELRNWNIKPKKERKHNWKLQEKRRAGNFYYHSFPISVRTKPTAHKQFCALCSSQFEKGERQIVSHSGLRGISLVKGSRAVGRTQAQIYTRGTSAPMKIEPRKVYTHPACFACFINYLAREANLPELRTMNHCDECKNRFKCWTEVPETPWQQAHFT